MQCIVFTWHMVVSYIVSIQCVVFTWHMGILYSLYTVFCVYLEYGCIQYI